MLVDLGRNDLGRVCVPGSVQVTKQAEVELFSHVVTFPRPSKAP